MKHTLDPTPASADVKDAMLERTLGSYRIVRKIAQGGMGAVYEAVHSTLGRRAAVKVLLRALVGQAEARDRFFNEAVAISKISHPCLVTIYEHGTSPPPEEQAYIVMEYLDGESLRARTEKQYLGGSAIEIMRQLASVLAATHRARIIHRDLKPDNIMLVRDDTIAGGVRAKVLDFGIAKLLPDGQGEGGVDDERRSVKTRTGALIGTPAYMSPEQCRGSGAPDAKSDVYALGTIFFEILYGEPPFISESAGELYALHMFAPPPDLKQRVRGLTPQLAALIQRMLIKKPEGRPSMDELLAELMTISSSGLVDGPAAGRPSNITAKRGHRESNDALAVIGSTSSVIRANMSVNTTNNVSSGEQVVAPSPPRGSSKAVPAIIGAGVFMLIGGAALFLSARFSYSPQPVTAPAAVIGATSLPAQAAPLDAGVLPAVTKPVVTSAGPATTPAATPAAANPAPAPTPRKDKSARKASRGSKAEKIQIDLWK